MSELRRGWWRQIRKTYKVTKMDLGGSGEIRHEQRYSITDEEMQHVRDFIDYVERFCCCERGLHEGRLYDKHELLDRGTPPEPEWLPVGVAPDREGVWQRKRSVDGSDQTCWDVRFKSSVLRMQSMGPAIVNAPVCMIDHRDYCYRRIEDL